MKCMFQTIKGISLVANLGTSVAANRGKLNTGSSSSDVFRAVK